MIFIRNTKPLRFIPGDVDIGPKLVKSLKIPSGHLFSSEFIEGQYHPFALVWGERTFYINPRDLAIMDYVEFIHPLELLAMEAE